MAPPAERDQQIHLRVSSDEVEMLRALAERAGLTASDIVRTMIRSAFRETFGEKPPKRAKR